MDKSKTKEMSHQEASCCPMRDVLSRLGDKWSLLLIVLLAEAPDQRMRFSELMRGIDGISQRMLTTTLRNLERDGMLTRHLFPEVPPRVEYTLTARGKELLVPVKSLVEWIRSEWPEIEKSRQDYDVKNA
jgi:DNA-binding HxlR family transcriptional regulator